MQVAHGHVKQEAGRRAKKRTKYDKNRKHLLNLELVCYSEAAR